MTHAHLRLATDNTDENAPTIALTSNGAPVHLHLHLDGNQAAKAPQIRSWSVFLLASATVVFGFGGYGIGLHVGTSRAATTAQSQTVENRVAAGLDVPATPLTAPSTAPGELAVVQQQLRQPATVTPPSGAGEPAANPFGLHP